MKRKILIDCDPGIDDTVAILLANSRREVEIAAVTTTYGNNTCENAARNAGGLLSAIGLQTRLAKGAEQPLHRKDWNPSRHHGSNGIGGAEFKSDTYPIEKAYAWDVIYEEAVKAQGELTIVTLGPLTNLAIALYKYEDLPAYVKEIVMMGGSTGIGNQLPFGEANVVSDPHGCQAVFRSGIPVRMAGLNATEQTRMNEKELRKLFERKTVLSPVLEKMLAHYAGIQKEVGQYGMVIHDAAAMAVALAPEIAESQKYYVAVETVPGDMYGRTVADRRLHAEEIPNVDVVEKIEKERYLQLLEEMMRFYQCE